MPREDDPATTPTVEASADEAAAMARRTRTATDTVGAAATTPAPPGAVGGAERLGPGTRLGRYVVRARLGAGGMGEVYAAHDPDLDRPVALKLLHGDLGDQAADRLRREARTMAGLSHRNLVAVHDVGEHDGRLFLAMELIDGATLREWARGRPWPEVLRAYLDAGHGLGAAHAAGVVHRDFKPDNVLRGQDGRVAVTDFGIARRRGQAREAASGATSLADPSLTRTGAMIGTPLYMAPEQLDGELADARSDQFAFAVALWEALYGVHPLVPRGADLEALSTAMRGGATLTVPAGPVPARVGRALVRALQPSPAARWPSLAALLAELDVLRPRTLRVAIAVGAAAVAALVAGAVVYGTQAGRPRSDAAAVCTGGDAQFAAVWSPARQATLRAAVLGTNLSYAPAAWDGMVAEVGDWRQRWLDARGRACRAGAVFREQSPEVAERRMSCFARQLDGLAATLGQLQRPDARAVENARGAVARLDDPGHCERDDVATLGDPPLPAPRAALARGADRVIAELEATINLGRYPAAAPLAAIGRGLAAGAGSPRLEARATYYGGTAAANLDRAAAAASLYERAARLADAANDDVLRARATMNRASGEYMLEHYDAALVLLDDAEAVVARVGERPELRAQLLGMRGLIEVEQHRLADAMAHGEAAVRLLAARAQPEDARLALELARWAGALQAAGRLAPAELALRRAIAILERVEGADHPLVAKLLTTLGGIMISADRPAAAVPLLERAIRIRAAFMGEDHPALAATLQNLGAAYRKTGRLDDAERVVTRALAMARSRPEYAYIVGSSLSSLGSLKVMRGHPADAVPLFAEVVDRLVQRGKGDALPAAEARFRLARALWLSQGDRTRALTLARAARAIYAATHSSPEHVAEIDAWMRAPDTTPTPHFQ